MIEREQKAKVYRAAKAAYDFVQQNLLCNNLANRIEELDDRFSIGFYVQQQMLLDSDQEYYIDPMWDIDHIKELNVLGQSIPLARF